MCDTMDNLYEDISDEEYVETLVNKIRNHIDLSESEIRWIVLECEIYSEQVEDATYYDEIVTISKLNDDYIITYWNKSINLDYREHEFPNQPLLINKIKTNKIVQYQHVFYVDGKKKFSVVGKSKNLENI